MPEQIAQNFYLSPCLICDLFSSICSRFRAILASSAVVPSLKGSYETMTVTATGTSKKIPQS